MVGTQNMQKNVLYICGLGIRTTVKVLLFVDTNFRGIYKMWWSLGSWIRVFKHYRQQSMGKLYFVAV